MARRAFIFDMDGTIINNMAFHTASWVKFFERRGVEIDTDDFFWRTAGRHGREIMREFISGDLSDLESDVLCAEKEELYRELYKDHRKTLPGFDRLMEDARLEGIKLAIATSAPPENIEFIVDNLALRDRFDVIVGAADVRRGKPHPDVFLKAAEKCGVPPAGCVVFEDAPLGIEAASRAGMAAVALTTTMRQSAFNRFSNVIAIAEDLRGLSSGQILSRQTKFLLSASGC